MQIIQLNEELCVIYMKQISKYIYMSMNRGCEDEWFNPQDAERKAEELKQYINEGRAYSFMAIDEEPKGFLWAYPYGDTKSVYLSIIYVDDNCRGRSVGRQLITTLENVVKNIGYDRIWLHTDGANATSRAFYSAIGYEEERIQFAKKL